MLERSAPALFVLIWSSGFVVARVPPLAAIEAWVRFGEHLSVVQLLGFAIALGGVLLARAGRTKPA